MWKINNNYTNNEEEVKKYFGLKYLPMTKNLLDTDTYKISMDQVYYHQFDDITATWDFKARNVGENCDHEKFTEKDIEEITKQIKAYCALRFSRDELDWLNIRMKWIHKDYTNFLSFWHPRFENFTISNGSPSGLKITFKGVQAYVTFYEIPILEIVAETYYRNHYDYDKLFEAFKDETNKKIAKIKNGEYKLGTWSEFGARRRLSYEAQDWLIKTIIENKVPGFIGTSNMDLARKYGVSPCGTMAHEFIMTVGQGIPQNNPAYSNKFALDAWVKEYGILNGIALTDTIGTDVFLKDFQLTFATLFGGVRHDSGDPKVWGDKMITHYKSLGIDPMTKTLLFSDSLNGEKATELVEYFEGRAKIAFGIGTWWSAPQSIKPLNIVSKTALVNGRDVAKLSDSSGKSMCRNPEYVDYLRRTVEWRLTH